MILRLSILMIATLYSSSFLDDAYKFNNSRCPAGLITRSGQYVNECIEPIIRLREAARFKQVEDINWEQLRFALSNIDNAEFDRTTLDRFSREFVGFYQDLGPRESQIISRSLDRIESLNRNFRIIYDEETRFSGMVNALRIFKRHRSFIWPNEFDDIADKYAYILDILYLASYKRLSNVQVLFNPRSSFVKENVNSLFEFMQVKFFLASRYGADLNPSPIHSRIFQGLKRVVTFILPFELERLGLRPGPIHQRVFERHGARGLYRYIYHTHGSTIALKYWLSHYNNLQTFILFSFVLYIAWDVLEVYETWNSLQHFEVKDNTDVEALKTSVGLYFSDYDTAKSAILTDIETAITGESVRDIDRETLQSLRTVIESDELIKDLQVGDELQGTSTDDDPQR